MPIFSKPISTKKKTNPKREDFKIIAVDCDLTLTKTTGWDEESCLSCEPNNDMIEYVRELHNAHHHIIIYTARKHHLYDATRQWLNKHNVAYDSIRMSRLACDAYICDKSYRPEELI